MKRVITCLVPLALTASVLVGYLAGHFGASKGSSQVSAAAQVASGVHRFNRLRVQHSWNSGYTLKRAANSTAANKAVVGCGDRPTTGFLF